MSTVLSIDPTTSWLGYYSRFNGGMISLICYSLLYWAFVANVNKKDIHKMLHITLLSAILVSIYGVLERLGIDKNIWQQDVQSRVFSTLGQPNWLAAWLVALIPITWAMGLSQNFKQKKYINTVPYLLSTLFFTVLLFTKSRSGLIGFGVAEIVFWGLMVFKSRFVYLKKFLVFNVLILISAAAFGTQYTPSISKIIQEGQSSYKTQEETMPGTVLENGGTESGTIRKIVWQGAVDIWKRYPIFGTGVETFAYSYYMARPVEHNLTSEWDFIYNKAHNEYLNFMANSGTVGILAYLVMVGFAIYLLIKNSIADSGDDNYSSLVSTALAAGYFSILTTNFFGFSVVPVQILFFLYPAFSEVLKKGVVLEKEETTNAFKRTGGYLVLAFGSFIIFLIGRYWYADHLYATGSSYNKINRQDLAASYLYKATDLLPNQSVYVAELSKSYANLAIAYNEAKQSTPAAQLMQAAIENSIKAVDLSPANVNMKRVEFSVFVMLSSINPNYLLDARDILLVATKQAPTDAKLFYNLGLIYSRVGENDLALATLEKAIRLKPNYKEARLAYAILLIDADKNTQAQAELEYILKNIDPNDSLTKQYLDSID